MPSKSSPYADEGTAAHALAEAMLKGLAAPGRDDMRAQVKVYVDHVMDLVNTPQAFGTTVLMVEKRVKASKHCWGTADAIVYAPGEATLYVRDLKYGSGVGVEVRGNLQLKIYALAALLTLKLPAKVVNIGIVQPRFNHPDGPCRSVDFDAVDLIEFHADLLEAEARVEAAYATTQTKEWEATYLTPSEKGCRWCLAAPTCPALKNKAQELAKQVFAVATVGDTTVRSYDPGELSRALDFLPILEGWIKDVREFAYAEAETGHAIPDYKLVDKRATRKWRDDEAALEALTPVLGDAAWKPLEVITPAAAEKLLGKQKSILDPLTVKESSGHTLVHTSDKREAVNIDAKSAFGNLSE